MKKKYCLIYVSAFILLMVVPLARTNIEEKYVSSIDNRVLMDFPTFGEEEFSLKLELYIQDRIGFRNQMIRLYDNINDIFGGELTHPLYSYGKDGYIFFTPHDNKTYNDYHKSFAEMVFKMQKYCEDRGTRFYFVFNPEKTSVLREETANGYNYDDSWVDELLSYMDELGINYIDNKEYLTKKHYEEAVFNQKYDAGHWNDLGCFYGTNNLFTHIHNDIPDVTELQKDEFEISSKIEKHLPNSEFTVNEAIPVFMLKTTYKDISAQYNSEVERNDNYFYFHYLKNEASNADKLPRILFFQGSYYNERPQFFVSRTSDDIGIHNYQNVMNLDYYFNIFSPDVVVFEVAEYTFANKFFNQEKMEKIDWNPALIVNTDESSFEEERKELLQNAAEITTDASIKVIEGNAVDILFLDRKMNNARYAYLITDEKVYDLRRSYGRFSTSVLNNDLKAGSSVFLFFVDDANNKYYSNIPVKRTERIDKVKTSDNVIWDNNSSSYYLSTTVTGNVFGAVVLQQITNTGDFIRNIRDKTSSGTFRGTLVNKEAQGTFGLRIRANSNLADEWIEYETELKQNQVCYYKMSIDELNSKRVTISKVEIYK